MTTKKAQASTAPAGSEGTRVTTLRFDDRGLVAEIKKETRKAILAAVRVSERRVRLLALDLPNKTEHSGTIGGQSQDDRRKDLQGICDQMSGEELHLLADKFRIVDTIQAEVDKISEPARQRFLALQRRQ